VLKKNGSADTGMPATSPTESAVADAIERAEAEWEAHPSVEWLAEYGHTILRSALDRAFSRAGDASIGVALTAAAVPLWMHLSLPGGMPRPRRAGTRHLRGRSDPGRAPRDEALRRAGNGDVVQCQRSHSQLRRGLGEGAQYCRERLQDAHYQLRSL
jgi:hypothetical protein